MSARTPSPSPQGVSYAITVQGTLDAEWADYFGQAELLAPGDGTTVIRGRFADQAALHGLLARVRDLGLTWLRVEQVQAERLDTS